MTPKVLFEAAKAHVDNGGLHDRDAVIEHLLSEGHAISSVIECVDDIMLHLGPTETGACHPN